MTGDSAARRNVPVDRVHGNAS